MPKEKVWLVWSNHDPNDSFEVIGETFEEAAVNALSEAGFSIAAEPEEREVEDES